MPLTVLTDEQVSDLLHNITSDDLESLRASLAAALHDYSTGTQEIATCQHNQPVRQVIKSAYGKTLFMPSQTTSSIGIKVVSLQSGTSSDKDDESISETTRSMSRASITESRSNSSTRSGPSVSSQDSTRPSNPQRQPSNNATSFPHHYSAKSSPHHQQATSPNEEFSLPPPTQPQGTLTLLTPSGKPLAFISATTLTAFRTALASTFLFSKRTRVHTIVVFGAGAQAYWHIRLALLLRGKDIHHVRIINRSFTTAGPLLRTIYTSPLWTNLRNANPKLKFTILTRDYVDYQRLLKDYVRSADAIFCTVPSTQPLFPASYLTSSEGRRKGRYLSLIGSYTAEMAEVDPAILRVAVDGASTKTVRSGGAIVVDSLEASLQEAGEIIQAGIQANQLVELGELIMIKRAQFREWEMAGETTAAGGGVGGDGNGNGTAQQDEGLMAWLKEGNVVYKSVGIGIMDLAVGAEVVRLAGEKGIGTEVDGF